MHDVVEAIYGPQRLLNKLNVLHQAYHEAKEKYHDCMPSGEQKMRQTGLF